MKANIIGAAFAWKKRDIVFPYYTEMLNWGLLKSSGNWDSYNG